MVNQIREENQIVSLSNFINPAVREVDFRVVLVSGGKTTKMSVIKIVTNSQKASRTVLTTENQSPLDRIVRADPLTQGGHRRQEKSISTAKNHQFLGIFREGKGTKWVMENIGTTVRTRPVP